MSIFKHKMRIVQYKKAALRNLSLIKYATALP